MILGKEEYLGKSQNWLHLLPTSQSPFQKKKNLALAQEIWTKSAIQLYIKVLDYSISWINHKVFCEER